MPPLSRVRDMDIGLKTCRKILDVQHYYVPQVQLSADSNTHQWNPTDLALSTAVMRKKHGRSTGCGGARLRKSTVSYRRIPGKSSGAHRERFQSALLKLLDARICASGSARSAQLASLLRRMLPLLKLSIGIFLISVGFQIHGDYNPRIW